MKPAVAKMIGGLAAALVAVSMLPSCSPNMDANNQSASTSDNATQDSTSGSAAQQKHYSQALGRNILPAPEGDPSSVARAALHYAGSPCPRIKSARRFDGDGSVVARCSNGRAYRIFSVEGLAHAMPLDCAQGRKLFDVDACDEQAIATGKDDSIERVLAALKQAPG
jgi:hypothetical protein